MEEYKMDIKSMDALLDLDTYIQAAKSIDEIREEAIRVFLFVRLMEIASEHWGYAFKNDGLKAAAESPIPPPYAAVKSTNGHTPRVTSIKRDKRTPINRDTVAMGSQPHKILLALQTLATHAAPLSAADLRDVLDGVPKDSISTILAKLHQRKLVQRIATHDSDSGGKERAIFKYYIPEDQKIPELPKAKG